MNIRMKYYLIMFPVMLLGFLIISLCTFFLSKISDEISIIAALLIFPWGIFIKYRLNNIRCPHCNEPINDTKLITSSGYIKGRKKVLIGKKCQFCGFPYKTITGQKK